VTEKALETLPDDILLEMATPISATSSEVKFDDDFLMKIAEQNLSNSVDTKTGAPASVRAQVAAAQKPEDRLNTLRGFYPDAIPVEVFDPEYGATKFGRGNFIFTNPETGKRQLFDEDFRIFGIPAPTLGDFADIGPEIAETVGAIGGGIAGAALGAAAGAPTVFGSIPAATAGFVVGEGLGSASAREAYISALDFFGEVEDSRTGLERFGDFMTTAAINAAAGPIVSKIAQGVKFVAGAPIRYSQKSLSVPAKEALERMNRAGVSNPTAGQVTANPVANLFESALANAPTSTTTMRTNAQQTLRELEDSALKLAEKYGGVRSTSEAAEKVMEAAQRARATYDNQVNEMYTRVQDLIPPTTTSDGLAVQRFAAKYIEAAGTATGKPELNPALRQAEMVLKDAKDGVLTFQRLKDFRTSLMRTVRKAESQGALSGPEAKVKELIGYVTQDLDNLVMKASAESAMGATRRSIKDHDIIGAYKAANAFVKENMKKGGDIAFVDAVIKNGEAEATGALRYVLQGSKEGGERFERLRRQFDDEEYGVLAGFMLGKMGLPTPSLAGISELGEEASKQGAQAISEAGFSPATFIKNWNTLSKEAREAMFKGTEYQNLAPALDDLVFSIDRVGKAAADMANPSGTARAIAAMGMLGVFGAESMFGKMIGAEGFEYGFGGLIGPYAAAKLMTNKDFVKWLSSGVEKAAFNPNSFGQHIRRLVQISEVNPDIRDEINAVVQGLTQEQIEPSSSENASSQTSVNENPTGNEMRFRESSSKEISDKLLPNREEMLSQMDSLGKSSPSSFDSVSLFSPLPSIASSGSMPSASSLSPTILPNEQDRELAMRRQATGGIAGLF
jgi:hypothetical protein